MTDHTPSGLPQPQTVAIINGEPATAHSMLAALIDIYDDAQNNAPEHRCYVESAWADVLKEARTFLASAPAVETVAVQEAQQARYRFLMALLIDRGVLTNKRYSTGVWSLQGIYGVDDSGLRGAGWTPEEAIDNAITAARLDPADKLTHWRETHEILAATPKDANNG